MNRCLLTLCLACLATAGCQSGPASSLFVKKDRTSFRTPAVRIDEATAIAARSTGADTPEQQELVNDLARRIQTESDPLVREAIVQSIAAFPMPLADQVLKAGLADGDPGVRQQCCLALGERGNPAAAPVLAGVIKNDDDFDVRVSATKALGQIKAPEAAQALLVSLEDNDPALQYAGVQAMKSATGKDYGGDVAAYVALARGEQPPVVATKPESADGGFFSRLSPF